MSPSPMLTLEPVAGEDVAVVDVVVVAEHRAVTADDVAIVVAADRDGAVADGVGWRLVAEGDVTEVQVEPALLDTCAGLRARQPGVVVAQQIGVVAAGESVLVSGANVRCGANVVCGENGDAMLW